MLEKCNTKMTGKYFGEAEMNLIFSLLTNSNRSIGGQYTVNTSKNKIIINESDATKLGPSIGQCSGTNSERITIDFVVKNKDFINELIESQKEHGIQFAR